MKGSLIAIGTIALTGIFNLAGAVVVNTTDGPINVTPGTTGYGEVAQYVRGGSDLRGIANDYPHVDFTVADAVNFVDHRWLAADSNNPIYLEFVNAQSVVLAFPGIDHGPVPQESLEFIVWGTDVWGGPWEEGKITAIFEKGADGGVGLIPESDDYSSQWAFSKAYTKFVITTGDHLDPHFNSDDLEFDALAAVPEPSSIAALLIGAVGMLGLGSKLKYNSKR